jgi:CDGSH-type Zn-finger protein
VSGGVPLVRRAPMMTEYGEPVDWDFVGTGKDELPAGELYELCRCGHSQNKPFCDNSHVDQGMDTELPADRELTNTRRRRLSGVGVEMTDDVSLCANAGFCGTRLVNIWKMIKGPDDPEVRARILRMVENCPSGRLEASVDGKVIEPEYSPSIAVVPNGPLWVRGGIEIVAEDGFVYEVRNRVTLCRCGESKNKPFCDGTHDQIEFKAP